LINFIINIVLCKLFQLSEIQSFGEGGFGVTVADILSTPSTPACAFPGASCAGIFLARLSPWNFLRNAPVQIKKDFCSYKIFQGENNHFFGEGGFGVPVADILSAPSTPACAFPGASCAGIFLARLSP